MSGGVVGPFKGPASTALRADPIRRTLRSPFLDFRLNPKSASSPHLETRGNQIDVHTTAEIVTQIPMRRRLAERSSP